MDHTRAGALAKYQGGLVHVAWVGPGSGLGPVVDKNPAIDESSCAL